MSMDPAFPSYPELPNELRHEISRHLDLLSLAAYSFIDSWHYQTFKQSLIYYGNTELRALAREGRFSFLQWLFSYLGYFEDPVKSFSLILTTSIEAGHFEISEWACHHLSDNAKKENTAEALSCVTRNGFMAGLEFFQRHFSDCEPLTKMLLLAYAQNGKEDMVDYFIGNSSPEFIAPILYEILSHSVKSGNVSLVKGLLARFPSLDSSMVENVVSECLASPNLELIELGKSLFPQKPTRAFASFVINGARLEAVEFVLEKFIELHKPPPYLLEAFMMSVIAGACRGGHVRVLTRFKDYIPTAILKLAPRTIFDEIRKGRSLDVLKLFITECPSWKPTSSYLERCFTTDCIHFLNFFAELGHYYFPTRYTVTTRVLSNAMLDYIELLIKILAEKKREKRSTLENMIVILFVFDFRRYLRYENYWSATARDCSVVAASRGLFGPLQFLHKRFPHLVESEWETLFLGALHSGPSLMTPRVVLSMAKTSKHFNDTVKPHIFERSIDSVKDEQTLDWLLSVGFEPTESCYSTLLYSVADTARLLVEEYNDQNAIDLARFQWLLKHAVPPPLDPRKMAEMIEFLKSNDREDLVELALQLRNLQEPSSDGYQPSTDPLSELVICTTQRGSHQNHESDC